MFLSQAGCASEPMLWRKRISYFPSFFNVTPLWSSQSCVLVIWHQCNTGNRSASCHPVMSIPGCAAPVYSSDGLNRVTRLWHAHLAQNKLQIFLKWTFFTVKIAGCLHICHLVIHPMWKMFFLLRLSWFYRSSSQLCWRCAWSDIIFLLSLNPPVLSESGFHFSQPSMALIETNGEPQTEAIGCVRDLSDLKGRSVTGCASKLLALFSHWI